MLFTCLYNFDTVPAVGSHSKLTKICNTYYTKFIRWPILPAQYSADLYTTIDKINVEALTLTQSSKYDCWALRHLHSSSLKTWRMLKTNYKKLEYTHVFTRVECAKMYNLKKFNLIMWFSCIKNALTKIKEAQYSNKMQLKISNRITYIKMM